MAEGVGFEPTRSLHPFRFSRPVPSATRRALHKTSYGHSIYLRIEVICLLTDPLSRLFSLPINETAHAPTMLP